MMKKVLLTIIFFITLVGVAQEVKNDTIYKLTEVDKKPEFRDGIGEFYKFIASKFRTLDKRKYHGKIIVEFIIEKDGALSNVNLISDFGYGSGDEAIRVIKLSPNWSPSEKDGKIVRTLYSFPITIEKGN